MGLFGKKKCEDCGSELYKHPGLDQYSCQNCYENRKRNKKIQDLEKRIKELEAKI
jgi:hypothetical protein